MRKKKTYVHLNQFTRDRLQALLDAGETQKEIATILKVDKSTVSREVAKRKRRDGHYDAEAAGLKASVKRSNSKYQGMKIEQNPTLKKRIITELKALRSPDEIAGRLRKEKAALRVDKDAIYKWLYSPFGQQYCKYLCTKRYHPRTQKKTTERVMIPNRVNVSERPTEGVHAEGDTFVSPKRAKTTHAVALVVAEKFFVMRKLESLKPVLMQGAVEAISKELQFDTLTMDNGIENRSHKEFGVPTYFCDAHSPWQKPRVENTIGLVRRWFLPKGTDLSDVEQEDLDLYAHILNGKYRKSLGYRSAHELKKERSILENISSKSCT